MSNAPLRGADRLMLLQTFVRIVDAGSLSAAARQLRTTQPTVSRRLSQLERSLGLRLLRRSTHALKLTDDGARCYEHAKEIIERWDAMETALSGSPDRVHGHLRVVVPTIFGQDQFIAPIVQYLQRFPQVSVEWLLQDRLPDFTAEGVDCAVRVGPIEQVDLIATQLAYLPRFVVAAPQLLGAQIPQRPEELSVLPWLALRTFYRTEITLTHTRSAEVARVRIQPRFTTNNLHSMRQAALGGVGACLASAWSVQDDLQAGRLLQLAPNWSASPLPVFIIYPPAPFHPARLRTFVDIMKQYVPKVPGLAPPGRGVLASGSKRKR